jgi:hypothetical protein
MFYGNWVFPKELGNTFGKIPEKTIPGGEIYGQAGFSGSIWAFDAAMPISC